MKTLLYFSILFVLFSCGQDPSETTQYSKPKKVIVSGKVLNSDTEISSIDISVNRIGFGQEEFQADLDDHGNFSLSFETYLPVDVWMMYRTNFLFLVHPGDSLHIIFDGSTEERPEMLKTIEFSGDRAETNRQMAAFQKFYFEDELYTDWARKDSAAKNYNPEQYTLYADSVRREGHEILKDFIARINPDKEVENWASAYLDEKYSYMLTFYPDTHIALNKLKYSDLKVPDSYYDYFKTMPTIQNFLVNGDAINGHSNRYLFRYVARHVGAIIASTDNTRTYLVDSIFLKSIIDYIPDTLFRQILMTDYLSNQLSRMNVEIVDRNLDLISATIKQPYLIEPLMEKYRAADSVLTNSKLKETVVINDHVQYTGDFMKNLIEKHQGKVLYVDVWATWCSPCLQQFKVADDFHSALPDVTFVYLCIDSDEKAFKNILKKFQLEGEHYYFAKEDGKAVRASLNVTGVPNYMIIDKTGKIVKQGFDIRPSEKITSEIIQGLL